MGSTGGFNPLTKTNSGFVPLEWTGRAYVKAIVLSLMSRKEENVHVEAFRPYASSDWWHNWTGELS